MTSLELEKVSAFVKKLFLERTIAMKLSLTLTQGEVRKLIALVQVRVKLEAGIR
jgi:ATP-dependent Lon protease